MPWHDAVAPARMDRIAVVAPATRVRAVLCAVADAGVVDLERDHDPVAGPARRAWERARRGVGQETAPELRAEDVDLAVLERAGDATALAGEAELEDVRQAAVDDASIAAFVGWSPATAVDDLAARVERLGGGIVRLPAPRGVQPPTLLRPSPADAFQPLVDTYATLPYRDVNPSIVAGLAYVVMFGMMFGDVGHGALLVAFGAVLAWRRSARLARLRWAAPFVVGAGLAAMAFGLVYGEAFGPTGAVPTLWARPLDHATTLLYLSIAAGAVLLAVSYVLGTVNRWREGGAAHALVALSGLAGAALYVGLALVALGWYRHVAAVAVTGGVLAAGGLTLGFLGLFAEAGGRAGGAVQAGVEMFDGVVRLGTNTVSLARLAAFGLTHAALTAVVWTATAALWHRGGGMWFVAAAVFLVGNALAFGLEALVAGIQALRLEYYELFSRIFATEGRAFRPWHVPIRPPKEAPCLPG
jgi:V/A-type H+-transporting ATPase subunit I